MGKLQISAWWIATTVFSVMVAVGAFFLLWPGNFDDYNASRVAKHMNPITIDYWVRVLITISVGLAVALFLCVWKAFIFYKEVIRLKLPLKPFLKMEWCVFENRFAQIRVLSDCPITVTRCSVHILSIQDSTGLEILRIPNTNLAVYPIRERQDHARKTTGRCAEHDGFFDVRHRESVVVNVIRNLEMGLLVEFASYDPAQQLADGVYIIQIGLYCNGFVPEPLRFQLDSTEDKLTFTQLDPHTSAASQHIGQLRHSGGAAHGS